MTIDAPNDNVEFDFDCSYGEEGCHTVTVNCPANADCNIDCSAEYACHTMVVNCPTNANSQCNIICDGHESCMNAKFYGQGVITACKQPRSCLQAKLPIPPDDYDLVLNCSQWHSCLQADVTCPSNGDCQIFCDGDASCADTNIKWPNGTGTYDTSITCSDSDACSNFEPPPSGIITYLDSTGTQMHNYIQNATLP